MIFSERTKLTANWSNALALSVVCSAPVAVLSQFSIGIGFSPMLLISASGVARGRAGVFSFTGANHRRQMHPDE